VNHQNAQALLLGQDWLMERDFELWEGWDFVGEGNAHIGQWHKPEMRRKLWETDFEAFLLQKEGRQPLGLRKARKCRRRNTFFIVMLRNGLKIWSVATMSWAR
jgi:hypothetical protein